MCSDLNFFWNASWHLVLYCSGDSVCLSIACIFAIVNPRPYFNSVSFKYIGIQGLFLPRANVTSFLTLNDSTELSEINTKNAVQDSILFCKTSGHSLLTGIPSSYQIFISSSLLNSSISL